MRRAVITEREWINLGVGCVHTFTDPDMEPLNMQLPHKKGMPHALRSFS